MEDDAMNPEQRVQKSLEHNGAKLLRSGNHDVYELNNGARVTLAKTPSDHRTHLNTLRNIKAAGGEIPEFYSQKKIRDESGQVIQEAATQPIQAPIPPQPPPAPPQAANTTRDRLQWFLDSATERKEVLLMEAITLTTEAERIERVIERLRPLIEIADEPEMTPILASILALPWLPETIPGPPPAPPEPEPEPEPETRCITITTQGVTDVLLKATYEELPELFRTTELLAVIAPDQSNVAPAELTRCLSAITAILHTSGRKRGLVAQHQKGIGRRPAIWKRLDPTEIGTRIEC